MNLLIATFHPVAEWQNSQLVKAGKPNMDHK